MQNEPVRKKLTQKELEQFEAFILVHTDFEFVDLMGLFAAIAIAPRLVNPAEVFDFLGFDNSAFRSQKEAKEIITSFFTFYNLVVGELQNDTFRAFVLEGPFVEGLSAHDVTDTFKTWLDAFLIGALWVEDIVPDNDDPQEIIEIMQRLNQLDLALSDDETRNVTKEEMVLAQDSIKAIHDYRMALRYPELRQKDHLVKTDKHITPLESL